MKARRLKDNEIVDVIRYEKPINRDEVYVDGKLRLYLPSDLDFNVDAITIDRKEYDELCKYRRYCSNWAHWFVVCPHCGEFNPNGYICANCGKDRHH